MNEITNQEEFEEALSFLDANVDAGELSRIEAFNKMCDMLGYERDERIGHIATEYGEPGYSIYENDPLIITANWNPPRWPREGDEPLTFQEQLMPNLEETCRALTIEIEWSDEWDVCFECGKLYRTEPDSYSWQPSMVFVECDWVCNECIRNNHEFFSFVIGGAINNPNFAFTYLDATDMVNAGFTQWEPDNEQTYYSGWFEHMTDDPKKILNFILEALPEAEVVFLLDEASQFYSKFSAWFRNPESDDDNDNG